MSEADDSYAALMAWAQSVRDARVEAGLTVDTEEWLTEIYEGRGYHPDVAAATARGEEPPPMKPCPACGGTGSVRTQSDAQRSGK